MSAYGLVATVFAAAASDPAPLARLEPAAVRAVGGWLARLGDDERAILVALHCRGLAVADVATALGLTDRQVLALRRAAVGRLGRAIAAEHRAESARRGGRLG